MLFRSCRNNDGTLTVTFDGELTPVEVQTLMLAGSDGSFFPANGSAKGNTLTVSAAGAVLPEKVRYAWSENPQRANLYGANGLQVSPFEIAVTGC